MTESKLHNRVDLYNKVFEDFVTGKIIGPVSGQVRRDLTFAIARRWSSWYPSFFRTQGGCYAIITRDGIEDLKKNAGVIVVDPGINFGETLRKCFNIEPYDIRTVLVSHHHPDHTTGLYELLTLTHESHRPCIYYLNEGTYDAFKPFQGEYNHINELSKGQIIKLADYDFVPGSVAFDPLSKRRAIKERVIAKTFQTFHKEIGDRHTSLGFIFNVQSGKNQHEIALLGDTDGNEGYLDTYLQYLKNAEIVVLHLGSFTKKDFGQGNKHLYREGCTNIVNCICCVKGSKIILEEGKIEQCLRAGRIRKDNEGQISKAGDVNTCCYHNKSFFRNLKLVLISELGLDIAPIEHIIESTRDLQWNSRLYPLMLFCKFFHDKDEYVVEFDKQTSEMGLALDERLKPQRIIFGTTAYRSLTEISPLNCTDEEAVSTGAIEQAIEVFHGSAIWAMFLCYTMLEEIPEILSPELENQSDLEKAEKLKLLLETIHKLFNTEEFVHVDYPYEHFIAKVHLPDDHVFVHFQNLLRNFLIRFILSIYNVPYSTTLKQLDAFSEQIFIATRKTTLLETHGSLELVESNLRDYISFLRSIRLFDQRTIEQIYQLFKTRLPLKSQGKPFLMSSCVSLAFLLSHEIPNITQSIQNMDFVNQPKERIKSVGQELSDLFDKYSVDSPVKFILSKIGMEIKLSGKELEIREGRGEWIPVSKFTQSYD